MHEDKIFPSIDVDGNETVFGVIEIAHPRKFWHALETTVQTIAPAVVRTAEDRSVAAGLGHDGGGVVAADVKEGPQRAFLAPYDDDRLSGDIGGQVVAGLGYLLHSAHNLPGATKDRLVLQGGDSVVGIPGSGDGRGFRQRGAVVVGGKNFANAGFHKGPPRSILLRRDTDCRGAVKPKRNHTRGRRYAATLRYRFAIHSIGERCLIPYADALESDFAGVGPRDVWANQLRLASGEPRAFA